MAKTRRKRPKKTYAPELDSVYFLKMVVYLIIGAQWVWFVDPGLTRQIPVPAGLILGILLAWHDHFQIDRKIEYAVLLVAMLIGFWSQTGVYITVLGNR